MLETASIAPQPYRDTPTEKPEVLANHRSIPISNPQKVPSSNSKPADESHQEEPHDPANPTPPEKITTASTTKTPYTMDRKKRKPDND